MNDVVVLTPEQLRELVREAVRDELASAKPSTSAYLTASDVAKILGCHPKTVCIWTRTRGLPAIRRGRDLRFKRDDVTAWMESHHDGR